MAATRTMRLVRSTPLSPSVSLLVFEGAPLTWRPGQHVVFHVPAGGAVEDKPFSIASAPDPDRPGRLELCVSREPRAGEVSLPSLAEGTELAMTDPAGAFGDGIDGEPLLLVAAGTGIAPFRAIVQAALRRAEPAPIVLLFGCRSESDILFAAELGELAALHPRFRFQPTLSRPPDGWRGRRGYVQDHVADLLAGPPPHVLVCGASRMVAAVEQRLAELGHPPARLSSERHGR